MDYNLKKASEKALKNFLKKKKTGFTVGLLVSFLITGAIALSTGWGQPVGDDLATGLLAYATPTNETQPPSASPTPPSRKGAKTALQSGVDADSAPTNSTTTRATAPGIVDVLPDMGEDFAFVGGETLNEMAVVGANDATPTNATQPPSTSLTPPSRKGAKTTLQSGVDTDFALTDSTTTRATAPAMVGAYEHTPGQPETTAFNETTVSGKTPNLTSHKTLPEQTGNVLTDIASMKKYLEAQIAENERKIASLQQRENLFVREADWYSKPNFLSKYALLLASWKTSDKAPDKWVASGDAGTTMDARRRAFAAVTGAEYSGGGYPI